MTHKITKKFTKKNLLLQENLGKFLDWREKTPKDNYSKLSLKNIHKKNKKQRFRRFLNNSSNLSLLKISNNSQNQKFLNFGFASTKLNLYKPLSSNFLRKNVIDTFLQSDFFPHKKPFMQFWIFPLLGASFLSLLTLNQEKNLTKQLQKFPNFSTYNQQTSSENSLNKSVNVFSKTNVNKNSKFSFLNLNPNSLNENMNSEQKSVVENNSSFVASYVPKKLTTESFENQIVATTDLEKLCLFYLNLTNQHVTSSIQNPALQIENQQSFFEKNLLQPWYLKNANFDWIW